MKNYIFYYQTNDFGVWSFISIEYKASEKDATSEFFNRVKNVKCYRIFVECDSVNRGGK